MRKATQLVRLRALDAARWGVGLLCSCVLLVASPLAAPANLRQALVKPRARHLSTAQTPFKIMPLGDSITDGYNVPGGYRIDLWNKLAADGLGIDFVGSMSNGPESLPDKNHEGHIGWSIDYITYSVGGWLDAAQPDVVLLMIGTNDMISDSLYASAPQNLATLLDKITDRLPNAHVFVASITPISIDSYNQRALVYNAALPALVQTKADEGRNVSYVEMYQAVPVSDLVDSVHPNAAGQSKMASVWYAAISRLLKTSAPTVSITSPNAGATFDAPPASIQIDATAADADGSISKVEFYEGSRKLGEDTTAPYSFRWSGVSSGVYQLKAKARDDAGAATFSDAVSVRVNAAPSALVNSPSAGAVFNAPATVIIEAAASDADGTIRKVEFYEGSTKLGEAASAPFKFSWSGVAAGDYALSVRATDNFGAQAISTPVQIHVVEHSIGGRVENESGVGLGGASVVLSGARASATTTDAGGRYVFERLPVGNYVVTASKLNYTCNPQSRTFDNLTTDQTADFKATRVTYSIGGRVTAAGGVGLSGVSVTLSGSQSPMRATTDAVGAYAFASVAAGESFTLTPSKTNYVFVPQSYSFDNLSAPQTADFDAMIAPGVPILISEESSTRALALDSLTRLREPFPPDSSIYWGATERRTRIMLFAMNFELLAGEDLSVVAADAEDASHRLYPLRVEYVGRVPGFEWLNCVVVRLGDGMGDVGDVLVRLNVRGITSNRVRVAIGHAGGGLPDDAGASPTPGRRP